MTEIGPAARSALVTGGSSGIGFAVASTLAARGYDVTLVGRSRSRLDDAVASLTASMGARARGAAADFADVEAGVQVVAEHVRATGRLDVVCISAGTGSPDRLEGADPARTRRMVAVNVEGPVALLGAALPHLRTSGSEHGQALAVLISSLAGVHPTHGFAVYSATKAALRSLARSVNDEHAVAGVRACAVCPGYVDTPMTSWVRDDVDQAAMLTTHDVAAVVEMLLELSPHAVVDEVVLRRAGAALGEP